MIGTRGWIVAGVLGLGACGGKSGVAEVVGDEVAVSDKTEVTERVSPVEQVAPPEDVAPAVEVDAAVASADVGVAADADVGVAASADVGVAASAEVGVNGGVLARVKERTPGCVGVTAEGRRVLSIVEAGGETTLRLMDFEEDAPEVAWPLSTEAEVATALADTVLGGVVASNTFVSCATVVGEGEVLTVPKFVPVQIKRQAFEALVEIEGNRPVKIALGRDEYRAFKVASAYYSDEVGALYLRLVDEAEVALARVPALDLGNSVCVPRPVSGKPIAEPTPPPFDPLPATTSCVAMTADGKAAAFRTWTKANSDRGDDVPNKIVWHGEGALPKIDLSCMARRCKPAEAEALQAAASVAGLVGCALAKGAIAVDGVLVPFVYSKDLLRFQGGSGWRTVHEFHRGDRLNPAESLWKAFQFPTGGPVFLYVGIEGGDESGVEVQVLDEAKMGLCAPSERGVKVVEVKASGAQRDASKVSRAGAQVVDGDLTTGWIATAPKKGQSAWLELVLDGEETVAGIELANGFQRRDGNGDGFTQYARAAEVVVTFADGTSEAAKLEDVRGAQKITWAPRATTSVKITIAGQYAGALYPNNVALSEVRVLR